MVQARRWRAEGAGGAWGLPCGGALQRRAATIGGRQAPLAPFIELKVKMPGVIVRLLISAVGLWLAALLVPGIEFSGPFTLLFAALLMGLVNALIRPVVIVLTLPLTIVTFGIFLLIVNAAMFGLVAWMLPGFAVDGFFAALLGWIIVSIVGWVASWYVGPKGRYELLLVQRRTR